MTAAAQLVSPTSTAVTVARGADALALLDERWDDLLARQPLPDPLLSATWLRALARWGSGSPLVAVVETEDRLIAGAALQARRAGGRFGPEIATWLGPAGQLFSPDLLVDPDRPQAGETLVELLLDEVDVLSLVAPASGCVARALAARAPWRGTTPFHDRWLLRLPPPRLEYARKQAAYDLRRAVRRGVVVDVRVAVEPADVAPALQRLFRVHRDRWRGRTEEDARFATTGAHRRWNMTAVTAMAAEGRVRLVEVLEDGRAVAGSLGLVHGRGAVGHTTAVRTDGVLRQPGHLAVLARAEALAEAGATTIDLGYGAAEPGGPKLRLGPEPDPLVLLFAARSPAAQRGYAGLRRVRRAAPRT